MEKGDIILVKLNGKNYITWSFHLKNFVEGQGMLGDLEGIEIKPTAEKGKPVDAKAVTTWSHNNAKVVTWILNSIDPSLSLSLQAFTNASDMWNHMKKII